MSLVFNFSPIDICSACSQLSPMYLILMIWLQKMKVDLVLIFIYICHADLKISRWRCLLKIYWHHINKLMCDSLPKRLFKFQRLWDQRLTALFKDILGYLHRRPRIGECSMRSLSSLRSWCYRIFFPLSSWSTLLFLSFRLKWCLASCKDKSASSSNAEILRALQRRAGYNKVYTILKIPVDLFVSSQAPTCLSIA